MGASPIISSSFLWKVSWLFANMIPLYVTALVNASAPPHDTIKLLSLVFDRYLTYLLVSDEEDCPDVG